MFISNIKRILFRNSINWWDDKQFILIESVKNGQLNPDKIWSITEELRVGGNKYRRKDYSRIERSFVHTVSWAVHYTQTEFGVLLDEFVNDSNDVELQLKTSIDNTSARIEFHLKTKGREGSTSYAIEWIALETDTFVCFE
jgi:hypothetical protein